MGFKNEKVVLSIATSGGNGQAAIPIDAVITRTVFDGPDTATYDWLVEDAQGKPITGRNDQIGDKIINEEYPVVAGGLFKIIDSDINGTFEVILWLKA